jgi:hypothetical protein
MPARPEVRIVSYPKSGRTWLRVLLGRALSLQAGLGSESLLDTPAVTTACGGLNTDFDHDGSNLREPIGYASLSEDKRAYQDKKVVFLARDVRDVLVSSYYEATKRSLVFEQDPCWFGGTLAEFVRSSVFGARKVATFYEIWSRNRTVPREFLLIRYEQLHAAPADALSSVLRFIGAPELDRRQLAAAVAYASFEHMRELERTNAFDDPRLRPGEVADPESFKVRRGTVGGYVDYLCRADVAYIERELQQRGSPFA